MKYIAIGWPEIQDYMDNPDYPERCFYDPKEDVWLIPEDWEPNDSELDTESWEDKFSGGDIGDLEDAMG